MAKCGYSAMTGAPVGLVAATSKVILGLKGHANFGLDLTKARVGYDGVTASAVPVLVELCYITWATQPPGTLSTTVTPVQTYGRVTAVGATAARDWSTTQPTVVTAIDEILLDPNKGLLVYDFPLGTSPDSAVAEGFGYRCTAPAAVNVRGTFHFERA